MFSPYYARRVRLGRADAEDHCAINVALYGPGLHRWALTERGRGALTRTPERLDIGPSAVHWDGQTLELRIDEIGVPIPRRMRGVVRLTTRAVQPATVALDRAGDHRWWPIAPHARIEVDFERPDLRFEGSGYLDSNFGKAPLHTAFRSWQWSRSLLADSTVVWYDTLRSEGDRFAFGLQFDAAGSTKALALPGIAPLTRTGWRIERSTRSDAPDMVQVLRTLEDTPFYARSLLRTDTLGEKTLTMHESLSLQRFVHPVVQCMLPFRMPRLARSGGRI